MSLTSLLISFSIAGILITAGLSLFSQTFKQQIKLTDKIHRHIQNQKAYLLLLRATSQTPVNLCGTNFHWQHIQTNASLTNDKTNLMTVEVWQPGNILIQSWGLNKSGDAKILSNSPALITRFIDHTSWLSGNTHKAQKSFIAPRSIGFKIGDFFALENCQNLLIDQVKSIQKSKGRDIITPKFKIPFDFDSGAMLGQLHVRAYYIAKSGLYVQNTKGTRYELVRDIDVKDFKQWLG